MKLLIAIPALDYIPQRFVDCLIKLTRRLDRDGIDFDVRILGGTLVYVARDKLVRVAINGKYTHVLWLDADMIFTEELLDDMLFVGKPFVTAIAHSRRPPHVSCLFKNTELVERFTNYPVGPFEVDGCGMACVLIETEILEKVLKEYKSCFTPTQLFGEDLSFCRRVRALGYEIWSDSGLRIGHIAQTVVYPD